VLSHSPHSQLTSTSLKTGTYSFSVSNLVTHTSKMLPCVKRDSPSACYFLRLAISISLLLRYSLVDCHVITAALQLDRNTWDNAGLFGRVSNVWLGRRDDPLHDCDGRGICTQGVCYLLFENTDMPLVACPIGTCYTGTDGWIGCCSV